MSRKADTRQFRDACRELGIHGRRRYEASRDLHAYKREIGMRGHMSYGRLIAWLREWKD